MQSNETATISVLESNEILLMKCCFCKRNEMLDNVTEIEMLDNVTEIESLLKDNV